MAVEGSHLRLNERGNPAIIPEPEWQAYWMGDGSPLLKNLGVVGDRVVGRLHLIEPRQFVGYYRDRACSLRIEPRRPGLFRNLRRFVGRFAEREVAGHQKTTEVDSARSVDPALSFCGALEALVQAGFPFSYRRIRFATSHPRGKIMLAETFGTLQSKGVRHKVICQTSTREYDPRLAGVVAAVSSLVRNDSTVPKTVVDKLHMMDCLFEYAPICRLHDASDDVERLIPVYANRADVRRLLVICKAILRDQESVWDVQVPIPGGECRFCNVDRLWEIAVLTAFQRAWGRAGRTVEYHPYRNRGMTIFSEGGPAIDPDVVAFAEGKPVIVIDAKYSETREPVASDVYQVLCYARRLGASCGVLVYLSPGPSWHSVLGTTEDVITVAASGAASDTSATALLRIASDACSRFDVVLPN